MKKLLLALAAILSLSACGVAGEDYPAPTGTEPRIDTVLLPDGRSVVCISHRSGLDCDWDNAR